MAEQGPDHPPQQVEQNIIEQERWEILEQIEDWLEVPVLVLGVIWLGLVILEFTTGLSPFLNLLVYVIWGVFIFDFLLRFITAPAKLAFLRGNWLTLLSLFIPALRIGRAARLVRVVRALRSARLIALVGSVNRGMRVLRTTLRQNGFGYVIGLTLVVVLVGAAGIYAYEGPLAPQEFGSYGEAVYWTTMIVSTMGTDYWPRSAEARLLTLLMAIYGLAVFGYVTATLATFFIGKNVALPVPSHEGVPSVEGIAPVEASASEFAVPSGTASASGEAGSAALAAEIRALRAEVTVLRQALTGGQLLTGGPPIAGDEPPTEPPPAN